MSKRLQSMNARLAVTLIATLLLTAAAVKASPEDEAADTDRTTTTVVTGDKDPDRDDAGDKDGDRSETTGPNNETETTVKDSTPEPENPLDKLLKTLAQCLSDAGSDRRAATEGWIALKISGGTATVAITSAGTLCGKEQPTVHLCFRTPKVDSEWSWLPTLTALRTAIGVSLDGAQLCRVDDPIPPNIVDEAIKRGEPQ